MDTLNLDIRGIIAKAAARIGRLDPERGSRNPFQGMTGSQAEMPPDRIRRRLLSSVWADCLDILAGQDGGETAGAMTAERALAELMRRGVPRGSIRIRKGSFRLRLENAEYRIYRRDGADTVACPWPSEGWCAVRIGGERLAEFLQRFDAHVPEIDAKVPAILETLRRRELEERKARMEREIRKTAVRSLLEESLGTLGLTAGFRLGKDGRVTLELSRRESARIEVPLEGLPELLRDPGRILASLVADPARVFDADVEF